MNQLKKFGDYKADGHLWITLSTGEYYPDILPLACELYKPVLVIFGDLLQRAHSSTDLLMMISEIKEQWMRVQLARVFRKYVSPETPVEMLKKKSAAATICDQFGKDSAKSQSFKSGLLSARCPTRRFAPSCGNTRTGARRATISPSGFSSYCGNSFPRLPSVAPRGPGKTSS
jgi:hypothetical protein